MIFRRLLLFLLIFAMMKIHIQLNFIGVGSINDSFGIFL